MGGWRLDTVAVAGVGLSSGGGAMRKKPWCSHIKVCNCATNDELKSEKIKLGGDLVFQNEGLDAVFHHVPYYWRACPLCRNPRPSHLRTNRAGQIVNPRRICD